MTNKSGNYRAKYLTYFANFYSFKTIGAATRIETICSDSQLHCLPGYAINFPGFRSISHSI